MPFLENTSGEVLLGIVLNLEVINVEVLSKQVKNCLKYISGPAKPGELGGHGPPTFFS